MSDAATTPTSDAATTRMFDAATSHEPRDAIFISAEEASRMLGLSRNQTYDLLAKQLIESHFLGRRRLVLLESVREFAKRLPTERGE